MRDFERMDSFEEREGFLDGIEGVLTYIQNVKPLSDYLSSAETPHRYLVKVIVAIGQAPIVFRGLEDDAPAFSNMKSLVDQLLEIDAFYRAMGGLLGYHLAVVKLIQEQANDDGSRAELRYAAPEGIDLNAPTAEVRAIVRAGVEALPRIAEMYPVGGAGDRLNLCDPITGEALPAALLQFGAGNLLQGLIRDLQAREYLYFKLTGERVLTPVAMMTSYEKNNYHHILRICEEANWFGRPKELFRLFVQPLVPVITVEGNWVMAEPLKMMGKPGGHGVIWREALREGIFDWFRSLGRDKILVRQINNPLAGTDQSLLGLIGAGVVGGKVFGTATCPRRVNAAEGMLVMVEGHRNDGVDCGITNVEYTEFKKRGIEDTPTVPGGQFSCFPSNTNTLFVDVDTVEEAAKRYPIPGLIINMKSKVPYVDAEGNMTLVHGGRLESTMQNVADYLSDHFPVPFEKGELGRLRTFVIYNMRRKTFAVTKSLYEIGKSTLGTPEGTYYDQMINVHDLLTNHCGMTVPEVGDEECFLSQGPSFVFHYHPALGPLYEVIGQKVRRGTLVNGAELRLEIAEADVEQLQLDGSLLVLADHPLGGGRCTMKNCTVKNRGINRQVNNCYWKNEVFREESMRIVLHGDSEFLAEGVVFLGEVEYEVPNGWRWRVIQEGEGVRIIEERLVKFILDWNYHYNEYNQINLSITY